jgi:hypothetical protein
MSDAMVGVADHQLARLPVLGVPVRETAGLIERAAPNRGDLVGEFDLPVTVPLGVDADRGIGRRGHALSVPPTCSRFKGLNG